MTDRGSFYHSKIKKVFNYFGLICDTDSHTVDNINFFTHPNNKIYYNENFTYDDLFSNILKFINDNKCKNLFHYIPTECQTDYFVLELQNSLIGDFSRIQKFDAELEKLDSNLYIVMGSHEPELYNRFIEESKIKRFKILYWPTYLIQHTFEQLRTEHLDNIGLQFEEEYKIKNWKSIIINKNFNKLYIHLNGKPRIHRKMVMDLLVKHNMFDLGYNSWNSNGDFGDIISSEQYESKYWKEEIINLDDYVSQKKNFTDEFSDVILNPNALFNLVGETSMDVPYVTEKIYRCFFIKQPFIAYGSKGINKEVVKYGFKLFDNIIDYSFDDIDDPIERFDGMLVELKKLKDLDYTELYNQMEDILNYNKNKCFELMENDEFIPNELITLYENRN